MAVQPDKTAKAVGAFFGGGVAGAIGVLIAGPVGALIGGALGAWLGHEMAEEASKKV